MSRRPVPILEEPVESLPPVLRHRAFRQLAAWLEAGDWQALRHGLDHLPHLWVFDRYLDCSEAVDAVEALFDDARDRKLLALTERANRTMEEGTHVSLSCCFQWGDAEGWRDHEVEFDLHLGLLRSGEASKLLYLGMTVATVDPPRHPTPTAPPALPVVQGAPLLWTTDALFSLGTGALRSSESTERSD